MAGPWEKYAAPAEDGPWAKYAQPEASPTVAAPAAPAAQESSFLQNVKDTVGNALGFAGDLNNSFRTGAMGFPRGAKDLVDTGAQLAASAYSPQEGARVRDMNKAGQAEYDKATEGSLLAPVARLGGQIAVTGPLTSAVGAGVGAAGLPRLGSAIESIGMTTGAKSAPGLLNAAKDVAIRSAGGAIGGGLQAGAIDPNQAKTGAIIGAALPAVTKAAGVVGDLTGKALRSSVSPDVAALATRAKQLGIDIPADRLTDSRAMDAVASGLNYVPFSGRAASEAKMNTQLNQAVSRTFGQDSSNVTMALRKAGDDLGGKFDQVLRANTVKMTPTFKDALAAIENQATEELGAEAASIIHKQIAAIQTKGAGGAIDGQTAYNIKKTLDRIGNRNSNEAFYARDLKKALMGALNDSLGPTQAAAFATTRQQYGNMLALEKLAKNGVEGELSAARLANMKNINNEPLQELADIAAQFVKAREGAHGSAQRAATAVIGGVLAGPQALALGAGAGRGMNMALNSNSLRNAMLGQPAPSNRLLELLANDSAQQIGFRAAPLLPSSK